MIALSLLAGLIPSQAGEPLYFTTPETSVPRITELLRARDWPTLARYYDLSSANVARDDLVSGAFFVRATPPADAHPSGTWRYRHPFAPGHKFLHAEPPNPADLVVVHVELAIAQGGGPLQRVRTAYLLRKSAAGYQLVPPDVSEGANSSAGAGDPAYAATGGISRTEAARRLGLDENSRAWHAVYSAALSTWFFSAADAPAWALERVAVSDPPLPPKAPPGFEPRPWRWTPRALPAVDVIATDELGNAPGGATRLRLAPALFADLLPGLVSDQDPIDVPKEKIWSVLDRARERGLRLRVYTADPARPEARAVLVLRP